MAPTFTSHVSEEIKIKNRWFHSADGVISIVLPRRKAPPILAMVSEGTFFKRVAPLNVTWCALKHKYTTYVYAKVPAENKEQKSIYLHRVCLGLEDGDRHVADHVDRNGLNNTDANLRIVTYRQNNIRRIMPDKPLRNNLSTGVRNVTKHGNHFEVRFRSEFRGSFRTLREAERFARKLRRERNLEVFVEGMIHEQVAA